MINESLFGLRLYCAMIYFKGCTVSPNVFLLIDRGSIYEVKNCLAR